jgi:hypothetical protein
MGEPVKKVHCYEKEVRKMPHIELPVQASVAVVRSPGQGYRVIAQKKDDLFAVLSHGKTVHFSDEIHAYYLDVSFSTMRICLWNMLSIMHRLCTNDELGAHETYVHMIQVGLMRKREVAPFPTSDN